MSSSQFEVWVVYAQGRRASHAGEATDESEQEDSKREEPDSGSVLIGLLRGTFFENSGRGAAAGNDGLFYFFSVIPVMISIRRR